MPRPDLSDDVVHWIKGETDDAAFEVLDRIVSEHRLLGGTGFIKGEYKCVCFSEAPLHAFHEITGKYRPFGIKVPKRWLFEQGGRPVIYQPDGEFDQLPETFRWRHMRYEPTRSPPVDFSWEREWRVRTDQLQLPPGVATIVVPDEEWLVGFFIDHMQSERNRIDDEAVAWGEQWSGWENPEPFGYGWTVVPLPREVNREG